MPPPPPSAFCNLHPPYCVAFGALVLYKPRRGPARRFRRCCRGRRGAGGPQSFPREPPCHEDGESADAGVAEQEAQRGERAKGASLFPAEAQPALLPTPPPPAPFLDTRGPSRHVGDAQAAQCGRFVASSGRWGRGSFLLPPVFPFSPEREPFSQRKWDPPGFAVSPSPPGFLALAKVRFYAQERFAEKPPLDAGAPLEDGGRAPAMALGSIIWGGGKGGFLRPHFDLFRRLSEIGISGRGLGAFSSPGRVPFWN